MKLLHITALDGAGLFGAAIKKQSEISKSGRGTFLRVGARRPKSARWNHVRYVGAIVLKAAPPSGLDVQIKSSDRGDETRLLSSFLGWLDRHFGDQLAAVNIEYRKPAAGRGRRATRKR